MKRLCLVLSLTLSPVVFAAPDLILYNAHVLPITGENDTAEAIAIKDGLIYKVGTNNEVLKTRAGDTEIRDMNLKIIAPGFIDSHAHFAQYLPFIESPFLYPSPMGNVNNFSELKREIANYFDSEERGKDILHVAWGYDDAELEEKAHPTREELDSYTTGYKFCAIHISGHLSSCNTEAFELIGYTNNSKNPSGGVIRRDENGIPTGVLEESAVYPILNYLPEMTGEDVIRKFNKVQDMFAGYGITTTQEGVATIPAIKMLKHMAEQEQLKIDVLAYAKWVNLHEAHKIVPMRTSVGNFKMAGVKLVGDGSPQGKTAYLSTPYYVAPHSHSYDYHGYPVLSQEEMDHYVQEAYKLNAQILSHSNGDASTDILLNAIEKADEKFGKEDRRSVVIHAQTARLDQIKRMKENNMIPSFFPAHTFFWGDWHRESVLGKWRASNISPTGWALSNDLDFTIHMDAPVLFPDMMTNMWTAINRTTRSGITLGEQHKLTPYQALEAVTIKGALQNFEENSKGSIEVGKRADLVVLAENPLTVEPMSINKIAILETIKDGETIFIK
ncbi:amidohydrolase [Photobacterium makurazakiensis]|uniref:amidohydrolase n=1 Tax=Photobacterium makurazakiensis TaxID=2910234 RepID=UPI003D0CEC1C